MLTDQQQLRETLIKCQLRPNKILDGSVLSAFADTPREIFLPPALHPLSYGDANIRLNNGRTLLPPLTLAKMIAAATVKAEDKGLVIGFATGYSLAILSQIIAVVYGVESDLVLFEQAEDNIRAFGLNDLTTECAPLNTGLPQHGPYDFILIEGAVEEVPAVILDQLRLEGRLVVLLKHHSPMAKGVVMTKTLSGMTTSAYFDAQAPYMPGFEKRQVFTL